MKIYNMQRMDQDLQVTLALVKYCWLKWSKSRVCNRNTLFTFNWTQVDDQSPQWGHEERHEIHTDILFTVCGDPELLPHYTQRLKTQWILLNLNTDGPIMSPEDITLSLYNDIWPLLKIKLQALNVTGEMLLMVSANLLQSFPP